MYDLKFCVLNKKLYSIYFIVTSTSLMSKVSFVQSLVNRDFYL